METVDRERISKAIYPELLKYKDILTERTIENAIAGGCEGYSFPNNLDFNVPVNGLAPESQASFVKRALDENMSAD